MGTGIAVLQAEVCMKKLLLFVVSFVLALPMSSNSSSSPKGNKCHVYILDVEKLTKFRETIDLDKFSKLSKEEQEKVSANSGLTMFGEFETKLCEECTTTKTYNFPGSELKITATVFYTDESMASITTVESMLVGIAIDKKAYEEALSAPDNAYSEITFNQYTDAIRVKKNIKVKRREYVVGIECHCLEEKPKDDTK